MRETTKRWIVQHIFMDGKGADWVLETRGVIKKANLTFVIKVISLLVLQYLSPTAADNTLTWYRVEVFVAAMVAGFEVDVPRLL